MEKVWVPVPVPDFAENYLISNYGEIKRRRSALYGPYREGRLLRGGTRRGYRAVTLSANGRKRVFAVHHLVAEAFIPPRPEDKPLVLHKDDDRLNCRADNLWWGTHAENSADMVRKERQARGEGHPNAVLTDEQVREIRRLYRSGPGMTQCALAAKFGVDQTCISTVIRRQGWKHI